MRGFFIVFEGITGSGKKTHIKLLAEKLKSSGKEVTIISFPDYEDPIARLTKRTDLDAYTKSLLFTADRQSKQEKIKELLEKGSIILCDRYCYSNFAYQSARGVPIEWLMEIEKNVIKPDLVILIDLPVELCMKRVQQANLEDFTKHEILERLERNREFLKIISESFRALASSNKETEWLVIDGTKSIEENHLTIWNYVKEKLGM